ncbi:Protein of unknown function [Capnocytophaga haemolytica]|jgi:hypothetical protein|uniref:Uncharacterized conserved protein n=1 Tax=Capnocytophaga haemolytica TaxID=45243 RepID=A0AAX2GVE8_9FLAO|nr:DUF262 domain-containing protein [Capnocytophaga haemolytica]AMD85132.1 hypothetical protein AXF12_06125 [Capnocytophaga haemolytica]SFN67208.1 Protein of unknown function [Capnocytophaga haemolytica]SNV04763.1 Uncharacterized conserved protein [Capnocytophaga haemolytica]
MNQNITPEKQTIESCLKGKSYYIDFYQREYVWSKETVETLLNDIFYQFNLSYTAHKNEELNEKTMLKYNWYYLNVFITNNVEGKVYIVDGQQRLTTLTLIACKLYHIVKKDGLKDILKECIFSRDIFSDYIFCIDDEKRKEIMQQILNDNLQQTTYKNRTEENLIARYQDISNFVDKNLPTEAIEIFASYFLKRLIMVELSIEKDDTPMVFEVINDRGEALKPFEIIKGKMVGALPKSDTETYSDKWDTSMLRLKGIEDSFFADYLKAKFISKPDSKTEALINQSYHRYIFDNNEIADKLALRKTDKAYISNIRNFIKVTLDYYAQLYSKIRSNKNRYLEFTNEINGLSGQYQIIMAACEVNDPQEEEKINAIAKEFDRLWILLILNDVYDSNNFQDICYKLNDLLKEKSIADYRPTFDKVILERIGEKKNTPPTSVLDYSNFVKKSYSNMNTKVLRYIFARVEEYICGEKNMQNSIKDITTKTGAKTGYHIEHILSHNDTNKSYFDSVDDFEDKRNLLGGLLLLKGTDNISSGNEEYTEKLKTYSTGLTWGHSLCADFYHTNKDFSKFNAELKKKTGVEFKPITKFDKKALYDRSKLLYNLVKIIWEVK